MTTILSYILLGSIVFLEGEAPPMTIGPVKALTGQVSVNFRQVDLNGDGQLDLLFPDGAVFQEKGVFPRAAWHAFPPEMHGHIDLWKDQVYCWSATGVQIRVWKAGEWHALHQQALPYPAVTETITSVMLPQYPGTSQNTFDRYLVDLNDTGDPELIAVTDQGVTVYSRQADSYQQSACFQVLPERSPVIPPQVVLWPLDERELLLPARKSSCRLWVDTAKITVMTREVAASESWDPSLPLQYRRHDYPFSDLKTIAAAQEQLSPPLPRHVQPCSLNEDGQLDYAGGRWKLNETAMLPSLIYESWVSLDAGEHFTMRAMHALQRSRPHCNFIDVDNDGDMDWIMEGDDLLEHGVREMLGALTARRYLGHEFRLYRQEKDGFSKSPSLQQKFRIHLEAPPLLESAMMRRYRAGECLNMTGDFNGDGHHDLIVRQRNNELSLYLYEKGAFPKKPTMTCPITPEEQFAVYDLNGDGLSDLIYSLSGASTSSTQSQQTVYFTGVHAL